MQETATATAAVERSRERVTGWQGDASYFRFVERDRLDPDLVVEVLRGKVVGAIFRGVIDRNASRELVRRFWESPIRKKREGEVCESVGSYVGAFHYHKPTRQYLDESAAVADDLAKMLDIPGEPSRWFRDVVGERLQREGITFRLSAKDGHSGCPLLIRHWGAPGEYALQPHDDVSQCRWPEQADFEIQRTVDRPVCAVNMCLENREEGGRLVLWNVIPDDASKARLGLYLSGSPYPTAVLAGIEAIRLEVSQGDIYVFNGAHVHGVEASPAGARRTTLAWNMGMCDEKTLVSWT
jgi:hypothetical protein